MKEYYFINKLKSKFVAFNTETHATFLGSKKYYRDTDGNLKVCAWNILLLEIKLLSSQREIESD